MPLALSAYAYMQSLKASFTLRFSLHIRSDAGLGTQRLTLVIKALHRVTMILVKAFLESGNRGDHLYFWHFFIAK